jgi:hypothetical protein
LRITPHCPFGRHIGNDQAHRPVAFGLQSEVAVVFEGVGEHDRERDRLAENGGDRLRVI